MAEDTSSHAEETSSPQLSTTAIDFKVGSAGSSPLLETQSFKWRILVAVTALKLLLIPSYRSTDFEVHRNWLAVTSSLPLEQWYTNATSEWTLDYPPLFAWFEWLLSNAARLFDPAMLQVENLDYASPATIYFQRGSVIVTDFVLASGAWYATRRLSRVHSNIVFFLIVANPGLFMVDHIHFQYNGFLLGILIWSLGLIIEGKDLLAGILFAILVNMKHLFASLGPVYFVYLFRHYCSGERGDIKFLQLATGVLTVCAFSFGPFIELGQLSQVLQRLFPFGRGLCHAYWAPNAWALYAALDKALVVVLRAVDVPVDTSQANMTGGRVETTNFALLPSIPPAVTVVMVLLSMAPILVALWKTPHPILFVKAVACASLCSFMLGYHVHEKAVLTVTIPAALNAVASRRSAGEYIFLSTVSTYALFPLIFTPTEYPVKVLLLLTYTAISTILLSGHVVNAPARSPAPQLAAGRRGMASAAKSQQGQEDEQAAAGSMLELLEVLYLAGLLVVEIYATWVHPRIMGNSLPFLPLMLISVYCAAGMVWAWSQPEFLEVQVEKQE